MASCLTNERPNSNEDVLVTIATVFAWSTELRLNPQSDTRSDSFAEGYLPPGDQLGHVDVAVNDEISHNKHI